MDATVGAVSWPFSPHPFILSSTSLPAVRDTCANALPITCGSTTIGDNYLALYDPNALTCVNRHDGPQVWFYVDVVDGRPWGLIKLIQD